MCKKVTRKIVTAELLLKNQMVCEWGWYGKIFIKHMSKTNFYDFCRSPGFKFLSCQHIVNVISFPVNSPSQDLRGQRAQDDLKPHESLYAGLEFCSVPSAL